MNIWYDGRSRGSEDVASQLKRLGKLCAVAKAPFFVKLGVDSEARTPLTLLTYVAEHVRNNQHRSLGFELPGYAIRSGAERQKYPSCEGFVLEPCEESRAEQGFHVITQDLRPPLFGSSMGPNIIWRTDEGLMNVYNATNPRDAAARILRIRDGNRVRITELYLDSIVSHPHANEGVYREMRELFECLNDDEPDSAFDFYTFCQAWDNDGNAEFTFATPHFQVLPTLNLPVVIERVLARATFQKALRLMETYTKLRVNMHASMAAYAGKFVSLELLSADAHDVGPRYDELRSVIQAHLGRSKTNSKALLEQCLLAYDAEHDLRELLTKPNAHSAGDVVRMQRFAEKAEATRNKLAKSGGLPIFDFGVARRIVPRK